MREWVDTQVKGGEYANASDYVRDLIRQGQRRLQDLKAAITHGMESGCSTRKGSRMTDYTLSNKADAGHETIAHLDKLAYYAISVFQEE